MTGTTTYPASRARDRRATAPLALLAALTTLALLLAAALQAPVARAAEDFTPTEVVGSGTTWRYLDDNTDPAAGAADRTVWADPAFDDAAWKTGTPGFGAVNGGTSGIGGGNTITTLLSYWITQTPKVVVPAYFFRTTVVLDQATLDEITGLRGTLVYDDSATVYVNGERVAGWGDSMITRNLQYQDRSGATAPLRETLVIPAEALVAGENTIAVEIHQCNETSSDVFFSLDLSTSDDPSMPFPQHVLDRTYASDATPSAPGGQDWFTWTLRGFADLRDHHPEILSPNEPGEPTSANDLGSLARNNAYAPGDEQVQRALADGGGSAYQTMSDALGSDLGPIYRDALAAGRLPKTKALLSGRVEKSVGNHEPAKAAYNYKRPFVRLGFTSSGGHVNAFDSAGSYEGLRGNGSFPSGHTNHGYAQGTVLATLLPELGPQILARTSEYGDNRLVLGFHYPLDVMGGRITGQNIAQLRWSDPEFRVLLEQARTELVTVLERACGDEIAACAQDQENYLPTDQALAVYEQRLTYGFPRVGEAGREVQVPAGAEDLLRTAFPDLTADQRRLVLAATALDSGYALDVAGEAEWQRLDLAAAMAAEVVVNADGTLTVDGEVVGGPTAPLVDVETSARCLAGTPYVAVRARNVSDGALAVALAAGAGERAFDAVAPGANAYQSFAVRDMTDDVPVTVTATGTGGATQEVTRDVVVPTCG